MENIEELEKKYKELGEEIKKIKNGKKAGKWIPEKGEEYWFIGDDGKVTFSIWNNDETDKYRIECIKIFKTEEEAKEYFEFIQAKKEYSYEFTQEEWEDENIHEYYYHYRYKDKKICVDWAITCRYENLIYFKTEEDRDNFIEKYEKQIEKYDFCI